VSGARAPATVIREGELDWESWDDAALAAKSPVRWKLLLAGERTGTTGFSLGVAEIPPGESLLLHHHGPPEAYYILEGRGATEIAGVKHEVAAGTTLYIPANALHRTVNTGDSPLKFLFIFPTDGFQEVAYHFDE